jgi:hypothetical protein
MRGIALALFVVQFWYIVFWKKSILKQLQQARCKAQCERDAAGAALQSSRSTASALTKTSLQVRSPSRGLAVSPPSDDDGSPRSTPPAGAALVNLHRSPTRGMAVVFTPSLQERIKL